MAVILILIGLLSMIAGGLLLTPQTYGVGLIGIACFLGILARITQAEKMAKVNANADSD